MLAHIIEQEQGIGQEYTVNTAKGEVQRTRKASQDIVLRWFVANQEKVNEYKQQTAAKIAERKANKESAKKQGQKAAA